MEIVFPVCGHKWLVPLFIVRVHFPQHAGTSGYLLQFHDAFSFQSIKYSAMQYIIKVMNP